ncbi:MAG: glycosyltransferase family 9 protein [Gammaproteobacteria bacterium]|nr:glycosyltransferase family 9 protein [Gammaproteobacteria bacterium]
MPSDPRRILVIRRDNIGDLVCTTPLFAALRRRFPAAHIALLTNTYAAPVVHNNPDLDAVYVYAKAKHVPAWGRPAAYWRRAQTLAQLRRVRFDWILLAAASYYRRGIQLARWLNAPAIGFGGDKGEKAGLDCVVARPERALHEVEDIFRLLEPLGIDGNAIPKLTLVADPAEEARARAFLGAKTRRAIVAVHISARHPSNRWTVAGYVALVRGLIAKGFVVVLLWSPGAAKDPGHPGDDALAATIREQIGSADLVVYPTRGLEKLIGMLAVCAGAVLSDGGAMHIAAALGKPLVCFFGDSDASRWHPWQTPHVVLQKPSRRVADILPEEALSAFDVLMARTQASPRHG